MDRRAILTDGGRVVVLGRDPNRIRKAVRNYRKVLGVLLACLVLAAFYWLGARASTAAYYPSACLGTWENVQHALGETDLDGSTGVEFTRENTARFPGGGAEIFCGNFLTEDLDVPSEDQVFREASVSFVWHFAFPEEPEAAISSSSVPSSTTTSTSDEASPGTSSTPSTPDEILPDTSSTSSSSSESIAPPLIVSSSPVSWKFFTLPRARAAGEETVASPPPSTPEPEETTPPPPDPLPIEDTPPPPPTSSEPSSTVTVAPETEPFVASSSDPETPLPPAVAEASSSATSSPEALPATTTLEIPWNVSVPSADPTIVGGGSDDDIFEITVSLDGKEWFPLGTVGRGNWRDATFGLPVHSWNDLTRLQISIRGLAGAHSPEVFLDGMRVDVEYEEAGALGDILGTVPEPTLPPPPPPVEAPEAKHRCVVEPFAQRIVPGGQAAFRISLSPSASDLSYQVALGSLPQGVEGALTAVTGTPPVVGFNVSTAVTSTPGSFSSVVIYRETNASGTVVSTVCQYNLILE